MPMRRGGGGLNPSSPAALPEPKTAGVPADAAVNVILTAALAFGTALVQFFYPQLVLQALPRPAEEGEETPWARLIAAGVLAISSLALFIVADSGSPRSVFLSLGALRFVVSART